MLSHRPVQALRLKQLAQFRVPLRAYKSMASDGLHQQEPVRLSAIQNHIRHCPELSIVMPSDLRRTGILSGFAVGSRHRGAT